MGSVRLKEAMERLGRSASRHEDKRNREIDQSLLLSVRQVLAAYDAEQSAPPSDAAREWRSEAGGRVEALRKSHTDPEGEGDILAGYVQDSLDEAVRLMSRDDPTFVDVVFDDGPGPASGRFVECEGPDGSSVHVGDWIDRRNGLWALRIPLATPPNERGLLRELREWVEREHRCCMKHAENGSMMNEVVGEMLGKLLTKWDELLARAPEPAAAEPEGDDKVDRSAKEMERALEHFEPEGDADLRDEVGPALAEFARDYGIKKIPYRLADRIAEIRRVIGALLDNTAKSRHEMAQCYNAASEESDGLRAEVERLRAGDELHRKNLDDVTASLGVMTAECERLRAENEEMLSERDRPFMLGSRLLDVEAILRAIALADRWQMVTLGGDALRTALRLDREIREEMQRHAMNSGSTKAEDAGRQS